MADTNTTKWLAQYLAALPHADTFDLRFIPGNPANLTTSEMEQLPHSHHQHMYELRDKPGFWRYRPENFDALSAEEVLKRMNLAAHYNACGYQIFARPRNYRYVFIDDLRDFTDASGKTIRGEWRLIRPLDGGPGHRHTIQIESSPGNHQFWADAGPGCDDEYVNKALSLHLAERFGGDTKAARNRRQLGRLPGYRNVKPKYKRDDGTYPQAILHTHTVRVCPTLAALAESPEIRAVAAELRAEAEAQMAKEKAVEQRRQQIAAGVAVAMPRTVAHSSDPIKVARLPDASAEFSAQLAHHAGATDRSGADFAIVCRMARLTEAGTGLCYSEDELIDVVAALSPKAQHAPSLSPFAAARKHRTKLEHS